MANALFGENDKQKKAVLKACVSAVLENGGETYRAEVTAFRLCCAFGAPCSTALAYPTSVHISISPDGDVYETMLLAVRKRTINLRNLDVANSVARGLCSGDLSLDDAEKILSDLREKTGSSKLFIAFCAGGASAFFSLMLAGSFKEAAFAFVCGFLTQFILSFARTGDFQTVFSSAVGGLITAAAAVSLRHFFGGSLENIIAGAIMPLVPGLALTNAVRDIMAGDLVSGGARLTEVLLSAISVAAGAGVALYVYLQIGGAL